MRPLYVSTFNAEPWNQRWTLETAQKKLAWTLGVPGFLGRVLSLGDGIVAFAAGYRQQEDAGEVFYLAILCVGPKVQGPLRGWVGEAGGQKGLPHNAQGHTSPGFLRETRLQGKR